MSQTARSRFGVRNMFQHRQTHDYVEGAGGNGVGVQEIRHLKDGVAPGRDQDDFRARPGAAQTAPGPLISRPVCALGPVTSTTARFPRSEPPPGPIAGHLSNPVRNGRNLGMHGYRQARAVPIGGMERDEVAFLMGGRG